MLPLCLQSRRKVSHQRVDTSQPPPPLSVYNLPTLALLTYPPRPSYITLTSTSSPPPSFTSTPLRFPPPPPCLQSHGEVEAMKTACIRARTEAEAATMAAEDRLAAAEESLFAVRQALAQRTAEYVALHHPHHHEHHTRLAL